MGAEYNSNLADIFSVQDEVSKKISQSLRLRLSGEDEELAKRYTKDAEAYELYLKEDTTGTGATKMASARASITQACRRTRRSRSLSPGWPIHALLCDIGVVRPDEMPKAKAAAEKAVEADPTLAEAYTSRAFVRLAYDWDWLKAQNDFQQALKLNPKYPTAHQWYASYLMQMGKFSLAKAEIEEAHKLDPLSPIISANNGLYSYYEHNYDDAIAKYKVTLQSDPDFWVARHYLALAYVQGMHQDAIAELRKLIKAPESGPIPDKVVEAESARRRRSGLRTGWRANRRRRARSSISSMRFRSALRLAAVLCDCLCGPERE